MKHAPPRPRRQHVTPEQLAIKSGDAVLVRLDSGIRMPSVAVSAPWKLTPNIWVIKVEGISGGYDLSRVQPANGVKA